MHVAGQLNLVIESRCGGDGVDGGLDQVWCGVVWYSVVARDVVALVCGRIGWLCLPSVSIPDALLDSPRAGGSQLNLKERTTIACPDGLSMALPRERQ